MQNTKEHFDYKFYLHLYKDLYKSGIKTEKDAKTHYINHGKKENRLINEDQIKLNEIHDENLKDLFKSLELMFKDEKSFRLFRK